MNNTDEIVINGRKIGTGRPTYVIAELSANHCQDYGKAVKMIEAAKAAGADAVKLQTYTPDTMTVDSNAADFLHDRDSLWAGKSLYQLYQTAYTPWDWQPELKKLAASLDIDLFSSPFDETAVDFLEKMDVPAYKIASFEIVDIPLIEKAAATGKPLILSTGMAGKAEISEALAAARRAGAKQLVLLKCCSAYPAPAAAMHLRTIPDMHARFSVPVGLSDHTRGIEVAIAAVALGACIIEKHFTLDRSETSPDAAFSLEPGEFRELVSTLRKTEEALGTIHYGPTERETESLKFRRSLFAVEDIPAGARLTEQNVRSLRPASGLPPKDFRKIIGRRAKRLLPKGTPLQWQDLT